MNELMLVCRSQLGTEVKILAPSNEAARRLLIEAAHCTDAFDDFDKGGDAPSTTGEVAAAAGDQVAQAVVLGQGEASTPPAVTPVTAATGESTDTGPAAVN